MYEMKKKNQVAVKGQLGEKNNQFRLKVYLDKN